MHSRLAVALLLVIAATQLAIVALLATRVAPPPAPAHVTPTTRDLDAIAERLERLTDVLERRADRPPPDADPPVSPDGPQRRHVTPPTTSTTRPVTQGEVPADVRFAEITDRQLRLEADERLTKGNDLAGAVARYETVLSRITDLDARADVLGRLGRCYARLGRQEDAVGALNRAVDIFGAQDERAYPALQTLASEVHDVRGYSVPGGPTHLLARWDAVLANPAVDPHWQTRAHEGRVAAARVLNRRDVELESLRWLAANADNKSLRPYWAQQLAAREER